MRAAARDGAKGSPPTLSSGVVASPFFLTVADASPSHQRLRRSTRACHALHTRAGVSGHLDKLTDAEEEEAEQSFLETETGLMWDCD